MKSKREGRGGWQAYKKQDTGDQGSHPESYVWLGLGNKSISVKVRERKLVYKYVVLQVTADFVFCIMFLY